LREDNKLRAEDHVAHDWYRFVLSFPAHLVRSYLHRFGIGPSHTVLDPFCGTGTTLVECKRLGVGSIGIEPNPVAAFASRIKVNWSTDPDGLTNHVDDGVLEIDNNLIENAIRPSALGNKNWLFVGHPEAGERSAVIYTLLGSCRWHGINPFDYLKYLFTRLPSAKITEIKQFTPAVWARASVKENLLTQGA